MFCDVVIPGTPLDELTYSFETDRVGELFPGDCVRVPLRGRQVLGVVFRVKETIALSGQIEQTAGGVFSVQPVGRLVARGILIEEMLALVRWVASYYVAHLGEVLGLVIPTGVRQQMLRKAVREEMLVRDTCQPAGDGFDGRFAGRFGVGVCCQEGVGRERLVISFLKEALVRGSVLFLLPEGRISEWLPVLRRYFSEFLIEYHSPQIEKQRQIWFSLLQARRRLVLGVRAAVWAPVRDLSGVVIVDAHWDGFKEERKPRYNARDVAIYRARQRNCPVLLCERVPTLETYWNIKRRKFQLLDRLPRGSCRENVFVVDMRRHRDEVLSPRLVTELRRAVAGGGSALCYINRKGLARFVFCRECGTVINCPECGVPAVVVGDGTLSCRYCNFNSEAPDRCPGCHGLNFVYRSPGVKMVKKKIQDCGLRAEEEPQMVTGGVVLVGTRGVLSGSLPANLQVLGVVNLDTEYALPDFRNRERAFRLLEEFCHLAQRYQVRLVVQTYRPDEPLIDWVRTGAVHRFLDAELAERREAGFPPFRRLVVIEFSSPNAERLREYSEELVQWLGAVNGVELFGPLPKPGKKGTGRLLIKMPPGILPGRILSLAQLKRPGIRVRVDVDPREIV